MVAVEAPAVTGVQGDGGAAHEHGTRHEGLQVPLGRQQALPVG
jgi:hypothetical protein